MTRKKCCIGPPGPPGPPAPESVGPIASGFNMYGTLAVPFSVSTWGIGRITAPINNNTFPIVLTSFDDFTIGGYAVPYPTGKFGPIYAPLRSLTGGVRLSFSVAAGQTSIAGTQTVRFYLYRSPGGLNGISFTTTGTTFVPIEFVDVIINYPAKPEGSYVLQVTKSKYPTTPLMIASGDLLVVLVQSIDTPSFPSLNISLDFGEGSARID